MMCNLLLETDSAGTHSDMGETSQMNKRYLCKRTSVFPLQENLLMSMMQVENTFFDLAEACTDRNVLGTIHI